MLFLPLFDRITAGRDGFGVFWPVVLGVAAPHLGTHQTPTAAPETGEVAGYLYRTAGGGEEFKAQRQTVFSHARVDGFAVELLQRHLQGRLFSGIVDSYFGVCRSMIFVRAG